MGQKGFGHPKSGTLEGTHIKCVGENMVGISFGITHNMVMVFFLKKYSDSQRC
jgi:hypothetical protein